MMWLHLFLANAEAFDLEEWQHKRKQRLEKVSALEAPEE